ncbi:MAG: Flp pilus assembly complex ATPase component TadA, partial [Chloroflexales bacterium]|nr:Flp pilus assembly complex ATPase component TadA [Chloroflexales bacterium]
MSLLKRIGGTTSGNDSPVNNPRVGVVARRDDMTARAGTGAHDRDDDTFNDLKVRVQTKLINELDPRLDLSNTARVRKQVEEIFSSILDSESVVLSRTERARMFESISADILGLGPLEILLADDDISEIMVNGPKQIYIEKRGKLIKSDVTFSNDEHVLRVIDRIVAPLGRRIDEASPMVDARLPDGSRVNAVIRPLSLVGPVITIRKFRKEAFTIADLIRFGSLTGEMAEFLSACVRARLNVVVSGGTGSGKTTTLNVLSSFIPEDERIITVENAAELQLRQEHVITLESRPPNIEGRGEVTIRDLVINCLRMRPERIVVGECRGGETLDMLQAMNT